MVENSYQSVEFDYALTAEQLEARRVQAAVTIQRHWRVSCAMARMLGEVAAKRASDEAAPVPGPGPATGGEEAAV